MARTPEWHRWYNAEASGGLSSISHAEKIALMPEGYTVVRNRFRYVCQHVPQFPAEALGIPVVVGLIVVPGLDPSSGTVPTPVSTPDADWLFIDDGLFRPGTVRDDTGDSFEVDYAHPWGGPCDGKSQRLAAEDSSLWITAEVGSSAPGQATFYFGYSGSSLMLLP